MSTDTSLVQYGSVDMAAAEEFAEQAKRSRFSNSMIKFPEGKTVVRVMPPRLGQKVPWIAVSEHWLKLPTGDIHFSCPLAANGGRCPACEKERQLLGSGAPADTAAAKKVAAKLRYYANAIERSKENEGPKLMPFGTMIFNKLDKLLRDPDVGGDFTHPTQGFDLIVMRTGTGEQDTKYDVFPHRDRPSPLNADAEMMGQWLKSMSDLSIKQRVLTYDEIVDMIKNGRRQQNG